MSTRKHVGNKDDHNCPCCGGTNLTVRTYSDTVDFRGLEFDVEGLHDTKCSDCQQNWESAEQIEKNLDLIREAYGEERDRLRVKQGLLTAEEIQKIRDSFGLTQRDAAMLFGGGFNAFNKYESGEVLQSAAMDRLLRLTYAIGPEALRTLKTVSARGAPLMRIRVVRPEPPYGKLLETIISSIPNQSETAHITTHQGTTNVTTTKHMEMTGLISNFFPVHAGLVQ